MNYSRGHHRKGAQSIHINHSKHPKTSSKTKILIVLGVVFFLESIFLMISYIRMSMIETENLDLTLTERKQNQELETLRPQADKLKRDIETLAQSHLPDLKPLEFDKVLPMEQDYVKNIVFTVSGKGNQKEYEYKMVMHNGTFNMIHPQVDILFFDKVGIQVGISRLGVQDDGTPTLEVMDRGEIRSFTSKIELNDTALPSYFKLKIWN